MNAKKGNGGEGDGARKTHHPTYPPTKRHRIKTKKASTK
jgi:hypothetical protein